MLKDSRESDAMRYRVVAAETGDLITDVVAACEEEGWTLTVHPDQRYPCRMSGPACRLEFRPVRIESVASTPRPVKYYQVGDNVRIRSASSSELGTVVSRYNGQVGIVEDVWDPGPNLFLNVRVGDDVVFCSPADLELVARKLQAEDMGPDGEKDGLSIADVEAMYKWCTRKGTKIG